MKSENVVHLIGNVGKDPEIRFTTKGEPIANFTLATSEQWTDASNAKQERTEWHRIEIFGNLAQVARDYVKKGSPLYIVGKLVDKEGVKRNITKIQVTNFNSKMILLGTKPKEAAQAELEEALVA
jgi:single-strand DNA-binding protein